MPTATVNIALRPLKLAFLVEPTDREALQVAIRISSTLWGGAFNPIIPVFSTVPAVWKSNDPVGRYKPGEILEGYLNAFAPDFVVPVGRCEGRQLNLGSRRVLTLTELLPQATGDDTPLPAYGVDLFEVLHGVHEKELKFVRRTPLEVYCFTYADRDRLFFSSVFGEPLPGVNEVVTGAAWTAHMGFERRAVDFTTYADYLAPGKLNIRRLLHHALDVRDQGQRCLFYMDARNTHDLIDFWNLRALGWLVIPIAKQAADSESTKRLARQVVEDYSGPHRYTASRYVRLPVLKSRSTSQQEVVEFMKAVNVPKDARSGEVRWEPRWWYPRLWDEWARDKDGATCCQLEAGTRKDHVTAERGSLEVQTVDPDFIQRIRGLPGSRRLRYANILDARMYSHDDILAEAVPDCGEKLTRLLSGIGPMEDWRFSKRESVYLVTYPRWSIRVLLPQAEAVFAAWMQERGFDKCELSPSGMIAKQMTKHLGGLWGLGTLANRDLINLLICMEDGKQIGEPKMRGIMHRLANKALVLRTGPQLLESYISRKMFRLGARLQCPVCAHRSWYTVDQLDYELRCTNCLESFAFPSHSPSDIEWAYRTFGPFSLSKAAEGAYSTLLVLYAVRRHFDALMTPAFSFLTDIEGAEKEIDLGLLFKESRFRSDTDVRALFAECKTYNRFERRDIDKMAALAARFPGSVIVFATLRDELTEKEKRLLRPLVARSRRYWKNEQPYNPVLILTRVELFAEMSFQDAWQRAGGRYAQFSTRYYAPDRVLDVCDVTQQLYLAMKPWHEEIVEQLRQRRNRPRRAKA